MIAPICVCKTVIGLLIREDTVERKREVIGRLSFIVQFLLNGHTMVNIALYCQCNRGIIQSSWDLNLFIFLAEPLSLNLSCVLLFQVLIPPHFPE